MRRTTRAREVERRVDEGDVRQSLREVPEHALLDGIVFLGEQADVVPERDEPIEVRACFFVPELSLITPSGSRVASVSVMRSSFTG